MPLAARAHRPVAASCIVALAATLVTSVASARPEPTGGGAWEDHALDTGRVRLHYVRTGVDAVPAADEDLDGTPDHVQLVAEVAELVADDLLARGFRLWLDDGGGGGDARLDVYLRELSGSDGLFAAEQCTAQPTHCSGWIEIENDFAGFGYPSLELAVKVLLSHELFHAVQAAYDADQATGWSEGSAVWNEEVTFPEQSDYERLVAYFMAKPGRPFDREGGGFGDGYPYGTAIWSTFLEAFLGDGTLRTVWERCEDLDGSDPAALDVISDLADEAGTTLGEVFIEFTRWNALTGAWAVAGEGYAAAAALPEVAADDELAFGAPAVELSLEGFSSHVVPLATGAAPRQITAVPPEGAPEWAAAVAVQRPDGFEWLELVTDPSLAAPGRAVLVPADAVWARLVVTSAKRGGRPWRVTVQLREPPPVPPVDGEDDGGGCGCQVARGASSAPTPLTLGFVLVALGALGWRLRAPSRRAARERVPCRACPSPSTAARPPTPAPR